MKMKLNIDNEKIIMEIIKKFDLEKGQYIDLKFFEEMYEDYKNKYTKLEFAQLLNIKRSNYYSMGNKGTKAKILMNIDVPEENKKMILDNVIEKYDLARYQLISYSTDDRTKISFQELREEYKVYFTEEEFAELIGIRSKYALKHMREQNNLGRILTNVELTNEDKENIFLEIQKHPLYREGRKINYEEFRSIFFKYKRYFSESEFAEILGITTKAYDSMKYCNKRCIIKNYQVMDKIKDIKLDNRFYTKVEIENICSKSGITVEQFIIYVIQKVRVDSAVRYKEALDMNNGIWIGNTKMSNSFLMENYNDINKGIKIITQYITKKYNMIHYKEDLINMGIEYTLGMCGDLEKNFGYNIEIFKKLLFRRLNRYIQGECVREKLKNTIEFHEDYMKTKKHNRNIQHKALNPLDKYETKEEKKLEEKIYNEIYTYYNKGYKAEKIIEIIEEKFEISKLDILNILEANTQKGEKNKNDEKCL